MASTAVVAVAALFIGRSLSAQGTQEPAPQPTAKEKLLASRACVECDLSGVGFLKTDNLKAVDLTGAKMIGALLYGVDLTNANLGGADLSKAVLSFANLTNTNFGGADLTGANLAGSTGGSFAGAITTDATVCPDGHAGPCR